MDVYTFEFWAQSVTDKAPNTNVSVKRNVTRYKTVYLANRPYGPKVTGQICLSRVDGSGTASCIVYGYSFFFQDDPDALYSFPGSYSGPTDSMAIVLAGPSSITSGNAHNITFQIGVSNMFAYATITLFVEPVSWLQRLLTTAVEAIRGPQISLAAGAGQRSAAGLTHVAYDRRTGEILQLHDAVALPGARLPGEADLEVLSSKLFSASPFASEHLGIASVYGQALEVGNRYSIDVKTQRLIAESKAGEQSS